MRIHWLPIYGDIDEGEFDEDILEINFEDGSYTDCHYRPSNPIVTLFIREDQAYKSIIINGRNVVQVVSGIKRRSGSEIELLNDTSLSELNKSYKLKKKLKSHTIKPRIITMKSSKKSKWKNFYS